MTNANYFTQAAALNAAGPNAFLETEAPEEVYVCSHCEAEHDDMEDARDCCKPDVYTRYRCSVCRDLHRTEEQAEKCHATAHVGAQPRQCPICMASAETFQIAADCHLHTHPTMTAWGRTKVADAVEAGMPWADAIAAHAED
jgi:rubrerythrin